jgi:small-conductance mechanosensitive channel
MSDKNPYETPAANLGDATNDATEIEKVKKGQKLIIYALLINISVYLVQMAVGQVAVLVTLISIVTAFVGLYYLSTGLGMSILTRIFVLILLFIPPLNILTMLVINSKATAKLRAAGYKVGLLGASKKAVPSQT